MPSTRRQSFLPTTGAEVQYEGSKSFWKTRTNLDLIIASHPMQNCLEVIAYEPDQGIELPRLYVNLTLLSTKLDANEVKLKVEEKKEASLRQKKAVNLPILQKEIVAGLMNQYITSRLQIADSSTPGDLRMVLAPMSGDSLREHSQELDVVMEMPKSLNPLTTCFQKKVAVSDIKSAMNQLEVESLELKRATRYAELATSSVDGFKLMLAEKMKIESEMKKKFSVARLRWIKAINRVLVQNYVEKVRIRLGYPSSGGSVSAGSVVNERNRPGKIFRRSIDNSLLENLTPTKSPSSLPSINKPSPLSMAGTPVLNTTSSLPVLSPTNNLSQATANEHSSLEKRKRRMNREGSRLLTRKSHETLPSPEKLSLASYSNDSVPSLKESYSSVSNRLVPEVSVPILVDIREHSNRALRLAKL